MSEHAEGPGWWLASDGRWYPPDQAPAVPPTETWAPPPVPPPSGMSTGAKVALAVVGGLMALIVLSVLAVTLLGEESERTSDATGTSIGGDDDGDRGDGGTDEGGTAGDPDVPQGYELIEGEGVSIAAPRSWTEIAPEDFAMTDEELRNAFPDAPEGMLEQGMSFYEQGAVLVAFDFGSEFASNVNVISAPGEAPLGIIEDQAENQLTSIGAEVSDLGRIDLAAGEALRIEYSLQVAGPVGTVTAHGVQFYVPTDGRTFVVTVSLGEPGDVADTMIDTFRVG